MSEYRVIEGDCRAVLATLDAGSVQTCITSPPYYGLRDYGTAKWEGGDPNCDHLMTPHGRSSSTLRNDGREHTGPYEGEKATVTGTPYRDVCGKCGGTRRDSQIGLEETPEKYVAEMVEVFREVRRVLRDDGTLWLNLGDSYAGGKQGRSDHGSDDPTVGLVGNSDGAVAPGPVKQRPVPFGYKPKDLLGIPWMVAFALRSDGWYLRSDIIWHKPNPMPESVTDRPTKSHEYLFLLTKGQRYFYDAEAIKEPATYPEGPGNVQPVKGALEDPEKHRTRANLHLSGAHETRNKRTVWTVAGSPFPGAHFATFPPSLIVPCVLAGAPIGGTVLDPFNGAGTTGMVACRNDRDYIGIELNPEYAQMARNRIYDDGPLLNVEAA